MIAHPASQTRHATRRAGFTLLEVLLASATASIVVFGAMSVLAMVDRADRALGGRSQRTLQLASLHRALQHTFSDLVMSDSQRIGGGAGGGGEEGNEPPPRLEIALAGSTQTLEVVVSRAPAAFDRPTDLDQARSAELDARRVAVRGVFELRPATEEDAGHTLWWRPLTPEGQPFYAEDGEGPAPADGFTGGPTRRERHALRLATGIDDINWQAFHEGERKSSYSAAWSDDLPAYVELELRTIEGIYHNWIFEIGWTTGPETIEVDTVGDSGEGGDGGGDDETGGRAGDGGPATRRGGGSGGGQTSGGAGAGGEG